MSTHRTETFPTQGPATLHVEIDKGHVHVTTADTMQVEVRVSGHDAEQVAVAQEGETVSVIGPRQRAGFPGHDTSLDVTVTLPHQSDLAIRTASAEVTADGTVATAEVRTGSGDVRLEALSGPASIVSGSGAVSVGAAQAELRIKSGSGDIAVREAGSAIAVSTGSGDVELGTTNGPAVVKTGSGDLRVVEARTDLSMATGSGDLVVGRASRGRLTAKGASGDVHVGVPAGLPVWTDISTVSGAIRSALQPAGEPAEGADHLELRAKTVSGDVVLQQV
ncbi:DUF4097 domain-containing protein [Nocardioides sp. GCM10027113]|uniref:DUF4097 family beta strand repeat-containing protein n=1 Tax=unclassified Nocardioides TaxID=2615069 RepID=UPI003624522C